MSSAAQAPRSVQAPPRSDVSAAVTQTTRSASSSVGWMRTGGAPSSSRAPEVVARRVVHLDRAAEVARAGGAEHRLELAATGPALEPSGDQDRVLLGGHPEPLELVDHGGDRLLARVDRGARERQRARLDDDRDPAAARDEIGQRRARERIAERLADRGGDVAQRIERRPGAAAGARRRRSRRAAPASPRGEGCVPPQRSASARRSRGTGGRNVGRYPSFGQVRDDSRFVARQSVTTTA